MILCHTKGDDTSWDNFLVMTSGNLIPDVTEELIIIQFPCLLMMEDERA